MFTVKNLAVRLGDKNILQNVHFTIDTPASWWEYWGERQRKNHPAARSGRAFVPYGVLPDGWCAAGKPFYQVSGTNGQLHPAAKRNFGVHVCTGSCADGLQPPPWRAAKPTAAMCAAAEEALRTVGLADKAEQDYLTLSGGERQLCILARTFVEDAPLLLLDEPDSALDLANRSHMAALLAEFVHASGKTALICLHDPMLMLDWCDTLIVLQNGQVGAMLYPRTDPVEALQSALAAVYGPLELVPVTDRTGRVRLALLPL